MQKQIADALRGGTSAAADPAEKDRERERSQRARTEAQAQDHSEHGRLRQAFERTYDAYEDEDAAPEGPRRDEL